MEDADGSKAGAVHLLEKWRRRRWVIKGGGGVADGHGEPVPIHRVEETRGRVTFNFTERIKIMNDKKIIIILCVTAIVITALLMGCPVEQIIRLIPAMLGLGI